MALKIFSRNSSHLTSSQLTRGALLSGARAFATGFSDACRFLPTHSLLANSQNRFRSYTLPKVTDSPSTEKTREAFFASMQNTFPQTDLRETSSVKGQQVPNTNSSSFSKKETITERDIKRKLKNVYREDKKFVEFLSISESLSRDLRGKAISMAINEARREIKYKYSQVNLFSFCPKDFKGLHKEFAEVWKKCKEIVEILLKNESISEVARSIALINAIDHLPIFDRGKYSCQSEQEFDCSKEIVEMLLKNESIPRNIRRELVMLAKQEDKNEIVEMLLRGGSISEFYAKDQQVANANSGSFLKKETISEEDIRAIIRAALLNSENKFVGFFLELGSISEDIRKEAIEIVEDELNRIRETRPNPMRNNVTRESVRIFDEKFKEIKRTSIEIVVMLQNYDTTSEGDRGEAV